MLFYRPQHPQTGEMWDTWLFWHQGTHYLYYLARHGDQWDNISMATSADGVHWDEAGPILRRGEGVTWMGTGSTWAAPAKAGRGRFQMNFSEWRGPRQTIFFAESDDLRHWERLSDAYEFVQDERWYQPLGRWDCIWTLPRSDGGLYGYWTATPQPAAGGRFGFGASDDGVHWTALPPPQVHGVGDGEVGAIERIGDTYYLLFGSYPHMVTLTAERPEGPFHAVARNRDLLGGHTYFTRFYPHPEGVLVNHHAMARDGRIYMGLLKRAVVDAEGVLRLGWWPGCQAGLAPAVPLTAPVPGSGAAVAMLPHGIDAAAGGVLRVGLRLPATPFAPRRGLYVECGDGVGIAVLFDAQGRAELCRTDPEGRTCVVEKRIDRERDWSHPARLRLVVQQSLLELYLDDILIECFSLPAAATGRIGLIDGGDATAVTELDLAALA
jgi:hypothetical protein